MYAVQTADSGDATTRRDAARDGRAAAMSRRRALAAGRSALGPASERVRTGFREAELRARAAALDATPPATHLGRALSVQQRRALSQGRQALNTGGNRTAAAPGAGAPPAAENLQVDGASATPAASDGRGAPSGARAAPGGRAVATDADLGRALSMQRRRQLSQGKQALTGGGDRTAAAARTGAPVLVVHRGGGR